MNRCDGHKANAAKKLEMTERTLYRYLDVYSIDKVEGKYVEIKDK